MGKKVYAIQSGFDSKNKKKIENMIVDTWAECLSYVKGVKNAKYKCFEDINDAKAYLNEGSRMLKKSDDNYPKDCLHVYVDGSYNAYDERYSYGLVAVTDNVVEYIESGSGKNDLDRNIRQIAGELKGALRAVEYAVEKRQKKMVLFHDYEGIAHHATGAWDRKESSSMEYYEKMQTLMKSGIEVIFVKVDSHTGDFFNELVDEKCKECLGISSDKVVEKWLLSNILMVANKKVKDEVLSVAPKSAGNIKIIGEENDIKSLDLIKSNEENDDLRYKELTDLYNQDIKEAKKKISKMLSKDKEKYILYLLNLIESK